MDASPQYRESEPPVGFRLHGAYTKLVLLVADEEADPFLYVDGHRLDEMIAWLSFSSECDYLYVVSGPSKKLRSDRHIENTLAVLSVIHDSFFSDIGRHQLLQISDCDVRTAAEDLERDYQSSSWATSVLKFSREFGGYSKNEDEYQESENQPCISISRYTVSLIRQSEYYARVFADLSEQPAVSVNEFRFR